ncbi:MAG: hypothetical protein LWW95_03205 [Candidatus Desulfofervidus auxilii]|nr:hypothetical protein [Candidatus Desulfofervidus auxilii]
MRKDPTIQIKDMVSDALKRFIKLVCRPNIPIGDIEGTDLYFVYHDFIYSLSIISILVVTIKGLLPNYFVINPASLINWPIFLLLLALNALIPSLIIFALLSVPLHYKTQKIHVSIFYHALRSYSVEIILVAILFVIGINRVFINSSLVQPINTFDLIFGLVISITVLFFLFWLIAYPISKYLKNFFSKKTAYLLGLSSTILCLLINPSLSFKYFDNILDYKEFCYQYISYKYQKEIAKGIYNKECLIGKCIELKKIFHHNKSLQQTGNTVRR